jgi:hypothetical protein
VKTIRYLDCGGCAATGALGFDVLAISDSRKSNRKYQDCTKAAKVDVDLHCYLPMDRLLERQSAIQRTLAARHLQDGHLVLYDITSSYFEGAYTQSDLVTFDYNRDGKRGHEQNGNRFTLQRGGMSGRSRSFSR